MTEENKTPEINPDDLKTDEEVNAVVGDIEETEAMLDEAKARLDEIKSENPPISYSEEEASPEAETAGAVEETVLDAQPVSPEQEPGQEPVQEYYQVPPQDQVPPQVPPYDPAQQAYYQVPPQEQVPPQAPVEQPYYQAPPQYNQQAPYYPQQAVEPKDHVAAGLLAIFLGALGIHKFYLGYNTSGFIMLAVSILAGIITCGIATSVMAVIGVIEGILYLTKSQGEFEQIYVFNKREWF